MTLPEDFNEYTILGQLSDVTEQLRKMGQNNPHNREEAKRRLLLEAVDQAENLDQIKAVLRIMLGMS